MKQKKRKEIKIKNHRLPHLTHPTLGVLLKLTQSNHLNFTLTSQQRNIMKMAYPMLKDKNTLKYIIQLQKLIFLKDINTLLLNK